MNIIEHFRSQVMASMMSTPSVNNAWSSIRFSLLKHINSHVRPTKEEIFNLGDHLSEAFLSVGGGREQGSLSSAGMVWESLVAWYLNLCLCGTTAVAIKGKKQFYPKGIDNALTVTHENYPLRSESDMILVFLDNDTVLEEVKSPEVALQAFGNIITGHFEQVKVINVQCKTNWNDNAQIPMLWNLVYSPNFHHDAVSIGINKYNIANLGMFHYAFVTVPTQKNLGKFTPSSIPVLRVKTLSGGAYWGRPTKKAVCSSIKEIYGKHQSNSGLPNVKVIGEGYCESITNSSIGIDWKVYSLIVL